MVRITFAATVLMAILWSFTPSHALTVQIYQCSTASCPSAGTTSTSGLTLLGTLGDTSVSTVPLAGSYPLTGGTKITIANIQSLVANVAISQTSSVKNLKLSNALITTTVAGTYLIRMKSDPGLSGFSPQPGGNNCGTANPPVSSCKYQNSVALNGTWVGTGNFSSNKIKVVLLANVDDPSFQTSVDQPAAAPTVTVVYNPDGKSFSRTSNTKGESIFLPTTENVGTCTLSNGASSTTKCGRNVTQKDLLISGGAGQTVNLGESVVGAYSESDIQHGARAEVARSLLCGETADQFKGGTTEVEKNTVWTPLTPLSAAPAPGVSGTRKVPVKFSGTLAPAGGTKTLVSNPLPPNVDPSDDFQFNLFLPCPPTDTTPAVTWAGLSNLKASFPTNAFTVNGASSDACQGTLRWVIDMVDSHGDPQRVEVLYGDVALGFNDCDSFSNVNMLTTGDARFLHDGVLQKRSQMNNLNNAVVISIKLLADGTLANPNIAITVALTSMQVNNDAEIGFSTQSAVAYCPAYLGPNHGYEIQITKTDLPEPLVTKLFLDSEVGTGACKLSVSADFDVHFQGVGAYRVDVLNNKTVLGSGFISF